MPSPKAPSAKVVARRGAKIVMNKAAVDALYAGMADGLIELGNEIIAEASKGPGGSGPGSLRDPETAAGRGVPMMLDTGFISVWGPVDGKSRLLHGSAQVAASRNKPRGVKTPPTQVVLIAGFHSPLAHLHEFGTVKMGATTFFTPALLHHVANSAPYARAAMMRYVARGGAARRIAARAATP